MPTYPYVRMDLRHRVVSVLLNDAQIARTRQLDDAHFVDVDVDGRAVGIEILTPDDLKIEEMAERFGFSEQAPTIRAAIYSATAPTVGSFGRSQVFQGVIADGPPAEAETEGTDDPPVMPPIIA
jgi:uncharacterized protein YuzE